MRVQVRCCDLKDEEEDQQAEYVFHEDLASVHGVEARPVDDNFIVVCGLIEIILVRARC